MLSTPCPISGRCVWLMLSPSASVPEVEAGEHSGTGVLLSFYNCCTVFVRPTAASAQASLMRWIWPRTQSPLARRLRESVSDGALGEVGRGEKDISVPCWVLSSLWSFVPSGLAGSQTLMGLVWLCDCRKKKNTNSSWPGSVSVVVC